MKLLLHIGTEKTGTTLLQEWLYANREVLSKQGVFLSDLMGRPNNRKLVAYFQQGIDDFLRREKVNSMEERVSYFDGFADGITAEIEKAKQTHDAMIISSEHFHSRLSGPEGIAKLRRFLKDHFSEIKVLCYFREQGDMRESLYSTGLKAATTKTLDEFEATVDARCYYYNFFQIAQRWSAVFGMENCDFRIYDRESFVDGDLRKDFLTALPTAVDLRKVSFSERNSNESLSFLQGRLFLVINRLLPYWAETGGVNPSNRLFKKLVLQCSHLWDGRVRDSKKKDFSVRFEASNRQFFETFLPHRAGFRSETFVPNPSIEIPLTQVADMVEDVASNFISGVHGRLLLDQDADILRDVALKYENGQPLTRREAVALMELASRARPEGGLIRKKIKAWQDCEPNCSPHNREQMRMFPLGSKR